MANFVKFDYIFEQSKLEKQQERKNIRVLFRTGGYGRRTMQKNMAVKRESSIAPKGPYVRSSSSPLRELVKFDVDKANQGVSVGPALWGNRADSYSTPLPQLLNEGGTAVRTIRQDARRSLREGERRKKTTKQRYTFKARPFVNRAFKKTAPFMAKIMSE